MREMGKVERIHAEFEERFGEPGYSAYQVERMLMNLGVLNPNSGTIKTYMLKNMGNGFAIDLEKEGIDLGKIKIKYFIPESKLEVLIKGLNISTTAEEMIREATRLEYRTK